MPSVGSCSLRSPMTDRSTGYSLTHDIPTPEGLHPYRWLLRRCCARPQPTQTISVSGSPFLFSLAVEFLVYDSSHQFCDRYTLLFCSLLQRRLLRFAEVDVGSIHGNDVYSTSVRCRLQRCLRLAKVGSYPALMGRGLRGLRGCATCKWKLSCPTCLPIIFKFAIEMAAA